MLFKNALLIWPFTFMWGDIKCFCVRVCVLRKKKSNKAASIELVDYYYYN